MIRKVLAIAVVCMTLLSCSAMATTSDTTTSEVYIPSENLEIEGNFLNYVHTNDKKQLKELITECENRKEHAHQMAEAARACNYSESHIIIQLAKEEWSNADRLYNIYKTKYDSIPWDEYPIANEVWIYLKDLGYNDYVCAGIMGNMMAETAGGTLNLDYTRKNSTGKFYGLCQWSLYYYPEVKGMGFEEQLNYLKDTIKEQIDYAGFIYKKGFNYNQFLNLQDEREAALAFAMAYERCAKQHYYIRCDYAEIAYNYFVS